jgi:predicted nucleic acid-binding protein
LILVDSSAWIEYLRATNSPIDRRLTRAIEAAEPLATTGMVVLEVMAGAGDEPHLRQLRRLFEPCDFLPLEEPSDEEAAAAIYRACRRQGATIRRLSDCLIASVAIRSGAELLHRDADFDTIARHAPLALVAP